MKKHFNLKLFLIFFSFILCISVVFAYSYIASDISYTPLEATNFNVDDVKEALDDLYDRTSLSMKLCKKVSTTTTLTLGDQFECILGDKNDNNRYIRRNFFLLKINGKSVDLILDHNITDDDTVKTLNRANAMNYFSTGEGKKYYDSWDFVSDIRIPDAVTIAKAVNNTSWTETGQWFCLGTGAKDYSSDPWCKPAPQYAWLFNYLKTCSNYGCSNEGTVTQMYWTTTVRTNVSDAYWAIDGNACFSSIGAGYSVGIRPVVTISKSNIY